MTAAYTINREDKVTIVDFHREPDSEEIYEVLNHLAEENIYQKRIWDFRGVDLDLSIDFLRKSAEYSKKIFTEPNRGAILVKDLLGYGVIRQFSALREEEERCRIRIFEDREEAKRWLAEG